MRPQHEESATVRLSGRAGRQLTVSALLQRDPQFLKWNRMLILGTEDVMIEAMRLQGDDAIEWEIHSNSDWPGSTDIEHRRSGTGFMRTVGMAQGVSIAENSIQAVAELAIYEAVDQFRGGSSKKQSAEFWFLQRSRDWPVIPSPFRKYDMPKVAERWIPISSASLRFRLISTTYLRDDERLSREVERLIIPRHRDRDDRKESRP